MYIHCTIDVALTIIYLMLDSQPNPNPKVEQIHTSVSKHHITDTEAPRLPIQPPSTIARAIKSHSSMPSSVLGDNLDNLPTRLMSTCINNPAVLASALGKTGVAGVYTQACVKGPNVYRQGVFDLQRLLTKVHPTTPHYCFDSWTLRRVVEIGTFYVRTCTSIP